MSNNYHVKELLIALDPIVLYAVIVLILKYRQK